MSFINVKKVELDNKDDIKQVTADVMLLSASLLHDSIENGNYEQAKHDLTMLQCSIRNLEYVLNRLDQ